MLTGPSFGPAAGGPPRSIVVLLHGVGADGHDLIGLAPTVAQALPDTLFVAPDAPQPCDLAPFGRQWFSLQDRRPAAMLAGVRAAAPRVDAFLDHLLKAHGLPPARLALIGFSQGAMMSLHVGLRRPTPVAAILGYSGALLGAEELEGEIRSRPPVLLVHGEIDDIVPVAALHFAAEALKKARVPVQWLARPGLAHSIDEEGMVEGIRFLRAALGEGQPTSEGKG